MTQGTLPLTAGRDKSLVYRVAAYLHERPNQWIDGRTIGTVAGSYGWRTRLSDLRRAPFNMTIENRQIRFKSGADKWTVSEYRYVPDALDR